MFQVPSKKKKTYTGVNHLKVQIIPQKFNQNCLLERGQTNYWVSIRYWVWIFDNPRQKGWLSQQGKTYWQMLNDLSTSGLYAEKRWLAFSFSDVFPEVFSTMAVGQRITERKTKDGLLPLVGICILTWFFCVSLFF